MSDLSAFEERIGYTFSNRDLLTRALTHKSFSHEAKNGGVLHNETFEFLGDSVLGFVIGDLLFGHFPSLDEGALSKMKAFLVSASSLGAKARMYGMGDVILLGVGEEKTGGRRKESLLANLFEAMIAAVYLDGGIDAARDFITREFQALIGDARRHGVAGQDYKSGLQELVQARSQPLPEYRLVGTFGPDHDKRFEVEVLVGGESLARASGPSKKEAEQEAARIALENLRI